MGYRIIRYETAHETAAHAATTMYKSPNALPPGYLSNFVEKNSTRIKPL